MKKMVNSVILKVVLPTTIGISIYFFFRNRSILFFSWLNQYGLGSNFNYGGIIITLPKSPISNWFVFSLPDGLWVFAFTNALILVWRDAEIQQMIAMISLVGIFVVSHEAGQAIGLWPGTFDIIDLATYIIALAFSGVINNIWGRNRNVRENEGY